MLKMLCLGDSIMAGWDGHTTVHDYQKIPQLIGKKNGWEVDNQAISATMTYKDKNNNDSMVHMLNKIDLSKYDILLLGYGTNDWGENVESLDEVKSGLNIAALQIKGKAPNLKVYVELPTESFINGADQHPQTALSQKNQYGFSQNDIDDLFASWAKDNGFESYDWRPDPVISPANFKSVCGDQCLHPTAATMEVMATRLASWMKETAPTDSSHDSDSDKTDHGDTGGGKIDTGGDTKPTQPTTPTTPINPVKPVNPGVVAKIKFKNVHSSDELISTFNKNMRTYLKAVNQFYDWLDAKFNLSFSHESDTLYTYDYFLRPSRRYLLRQVAFSLQSVNRLIDAFNDNWLLDPETGVKLPSVSYSINRKMLINDEMFASYNGLWSEIAKTINKLSEIQSVYND